MRKQKEKTTKNIDKIKQSTITICFIGLLIYRSKKMTVLLNSTKKRNIKKVK